MLKTSTRIALRFSGLTAILLVIFGIIINLIFFLFWVRGEQHLLKVPLEVKGHIELTVEAKRWLREYFQDIALIDKATPLAQEIMEEHHRLNLVNYDDHRYMYKDVVDRIIVRDVTRAVAQQWGLIRLSLVLLILFTFISYVLARKVVRYALSDLDKLVAHVKKIDVKSLTTPLQFSHLPQDDELRVVADAINDANTSLNEQIELIKRFVSHASHELKTPLMIMQTDSELAIKAKTFQQWLEKNITTIGHLNRLMEALLLLTRGQQELQLAPLTLANIINPLITSAQQATHKELHWEIALDESVIQPAHQGVVERIVSNLLDNAVKYTPSHGTITVSLDPHALVVSDTGQGIELNDLGKIREPFRQADTSKWADNGFGLGLSIVQQLVKLLNRRIIVESTPWHGTTFTVYFSA